MLARFLLIASVVFISVTNALAQAPGSANATDPKWRSPNINDSPSRNAPAGIGRGGLDDGVAPLDADGLRSVAVPQRRSIARVTSGEPVLPHSQGQVWREYDISPYTLRVSSTNRPEQAIVDWILRETGYETWHSEPFGFLSADRRSLRVYHTPEMHAVVNDAVDRFVNSEAESQAFGLRVVTVGHPNWRAKTVSILKPLPVQTQGIQAWLVHKEDAAAMLAELRRRNDFREHSSPHMLVQNGQSSTVSALQPRTYTRNVTLQANAWPSYTPELAQFEEGFSLELNPLLSLDGRTIDAVIKCNIDQLEKLVPVTLEVPSSVAQRQRAQIEVPQVTHCRLHERFRWPTDQVLIVGMGVVATPLPVEPNPLLRVLPITSSAQRADLLVFVESKGKVTPPTAPSAPATARSAQRDARIYRGRY